MTYSEHNPERLAEHRFLGMRAHPQSVWLIVIMYDPRMCIPNTLLGPNAGTPDPGVLEMQLSRVLDLQSVKHIWLPAEGVRALLGDGLALKVEDGSD